MTIPSTLKEIEPTAFVGCRSIKIEFLEGRQTLGKDEVGSGIWNSFFRDSKAE